MLTLFYRLPRLTVLALLVALAGGLGAMMSLGRQEDPTLTERYGFIITTLPGADAERMEALVSDPLESAIRELSEIDEIDSVSRANVSQVGVKLRDDLTRTEVDNAWTLVRQQADVAHTGMPDGTSVPDVERAYIGASTILVSLVWEGEGEPQLAVMARMARNLEDMLGNLKGTEETEVYGLPEEEIRVVVDPDALAAAGLNTRQAAGLIQAADAKAPAGQLRSGRVNIGLEVGGELTSIARIRGIPLVQRADGSAVRVGDVARVNKGLKDPPDVLNFHNGKRAVTVGAFIQPNLRVDKWAVRARLAVAEFASTAPPGIAIETVFDQSHYTEARLNGLAKNLGISALIVFAVLFFIMGWRAAFVVGMALPLTVCLVLILFNIFNMPLHQMSVTGLVISLGLLIDNAIVVVDDYDQLRARGETKLDAIDKALRHLFGPLFASTLTTALAFAPIALMPGPAGEFIGMLGISVIFAIVSSFLIAMTVIPALAGMFDRERKPGEKRRWWRDGIAFNVLSDGYRWTVGVVLHFPPLGIMMGLVPAFLGFWLGGTLPTQFFPQTERDQFQVEITLPPSASIEETILATERATEILMAYPRVTGVNWTLGEAAPRVYYNAFNNQQGVAGFAAGWVQLDDAASTRIILPAVQREMREAFPEAQFLALPYEQGPPSDAPIGFSFKGDDLTVLNELGNEARRILAGTPGVTYTQASLLLGAPKLTLQADETAAAIAGERLVELAGDLNAELEGVIAGSVLEGVEEIPVRVIAPNSRRGSLSELRSQTIGNRPGQPGAPLSALGDMVLTPDTAIITRSDGRRVNTVLGFLEPYALPAPTMEKFMVRLDEAGFVTPPGYEFGISGEAENSSEAMGGLIGTAIPLLLFMAGAVALVFNSFRQAFLILTTGFLSIGLAMFGIWMFNLPMGFNGIVGAMGLLGIAINGSIVVLSQLKASPAAMADDVMAQREVVVDATRHIVATTLTTMGGFVPILLTGDAFWMPLATAIAGGVAGSAILALYFTPAAFRLMTMRPFSRFFGWIFGRGDVQAQAAE